MMEPRRYQSDALDALDEAHRAGVVRPLVVHPTGTGKTITFAHLIARRAALGRALVLVHRDELAQQTVNKLGLVAPELVTGIVKAERNEVGADVVVGSVQTLQRETRLDQLLAAGPIETVVVDEAHHAPAPSWTRILTKLGSFSPYGPLTAGFTATPERDGRRLGVWERVVSYVSIREAITVHDCLVRPVGQVIETSVDLDRVRVTKGDFQEGDLGEAMESSGAIEEIADGYVKYARDRRGLAFTPTVASSQHLALALAERNIVAEHLDGTTPTWERRAILRRLHTGETQVVANCAVLTEGFDEPAVDCVLVARPTKFHGLYIQMVGRGLRKYPGKSDCLVLDVVGASERHDLVAVVDLGLADTDRRKKPAEPGEARQCPTCGGPCTDPSHLCRLCSRPLPAAAIRDGRVRHDDCRATRTGAVDVFGASRLRWLPVEDSWCLGAGKEVVVMAPTGPDTWRLVTYEAGRLRVLHDQLPADWAQGIGEDRAKAFENLARRDARWLSYPVSDAQKSRLEQEGFPAAKMHRVRTRGEAADLLTRIQGRRAVRKLRSGR